MTIQTDASPGLRFARHGGPTLQDGSAWLRVAGLGLLFALAGCQPAPPSPESRAKTTPATPAPGPLARPPAALPPTPPAVALPSIDVPADRPLYTCEVAGSTAAIAFPPSTDNLCRRHPEMGPCQYERNACRARGGRVVTALGEEVSVAVEAEYDRKVQRVRFQADAAPPKR